MKKTSLIIIAMIFLQIIAFGQKGVITGKLIDLKTSKPASGITVILYGTTLGVETDIEGNFIFSKLKYSDTEIIVHGTEVIGKPHTKGNNFYSISLRNIGLNKKNKEVDLGTIYLAEVDDIETFSKISQTVI